MRKRARLFLLLFAQILKAGPPPVAATAFDSYCETVEARTKQPSPRSPESPLQPGELIIERIAAPDLPGALLHHWRGAAFVPGATAANFEQLLRDFDSYPRYFSPQVLEAKVLSQNVLSQDGPHLKARMRVRQHHIITVVLDATYDITFGQLDPLHRYSISKSTRIDEVDSAEDHGFLWRLNTYWSYEERDGGLYLRIEAVSLTRTIPRGLGWAIGPYITSIPRESLEFTLRSARNALQKRT